MKKQGLYNDTLILWSADHGDGQADHHHWRKGFPYEFSSHIPMIFKWPAAWDSSATIAKGSTLPHVTELRDVFPTMLDAAGATDIIPGNYSMDGDSKFWPAGIYADAGALAANTAPARIGLTRYIVVAGFKVCSALSRRRTAARAEVESGASGWNSSTTFATTRRITGMRSPMAA